MDKFGAHQVYAREEPRSRRSPEGYDASYLDEDVLARLTSHEGLAILPPINLGVVLLNHGSWREIRDRLGSMFDYLWRFSNWLARNPSLTDDPDVQKLRERHGALVERDVAGELPYPSSNRWIREQIAFLLTLGISPPLDLGLLSSTDIWQGCETADPQIMENAVLAHYFSGNLTLFQQWLSTRR